VPQLFSASQVIDLISHDQGSDFYGKLKSASLDRPILLDARSSSRRLLLF
jgi:hypothetical protein